MVGLSGVVRQPLEPEGLVFVNGELWKAESESGPLPVETGVVVTQQNGFQLRVRKT